MNKAILAVPLAAVLAVSMIVMPTAYAVMNINDAKGDTGDPNFDIRRAGFDDDGNPYIKVSGIAGGTSSGEECNPAFAYLFIFTSGNAYAVASHDCFSDSAEGDGASDWHAHGFTAAFSASGADTAGHFACITSANDDGVASLKVHRVTLLGTGETDLDHVATVTIVGGEPTEDCPDVGIDAALYVDVLDVAAPA